ncbi:cytochrome P450, partial [Caldifermentibacillus hisashii]|uniref:cytochrome P450 n=1 Tax=Caldifermentibacillus hisashii TaxID=996558 RepID=UPI002E24A171
QTSAFLIAFLCTFLLQNTDEEIEYCFWCSEQLEKYLLPIIESKKDSSGNDLISILQRSEFNGIKMTSQEILALTLNILLAATEPVDKTLALLFYNLLQNPKQFEDVKNNRKLLKNAINETLRFKPPVQFIPRQVSREVTIKGVLIPKNAVIINMIGAANRDPKAFSNPDKFDIYRSIEDNKAFTSHSQNLAFGYGTHTCVGASLALMQLELVANIILDSFKNIELDESFSYEEKGVNFHDISSEILVKFSNSSRFRCILYP